MISSSQNPKVQWVRRLQSKPRERKTERVFVVEGVRLLEEVQQSSWQVECIFYDENLSERGMHLVSSYQTHNMQVEAVSSRVMRSMSDTKSPQGILAVVHKQFLPIPEQLDFILILDQIRDPGNLGTILRSAAAAGVQTVFSTPGTADLFSPKVLRSGMGAHFRLPLRDSNWEAIKSQIDHSKMHCYLASVDGGEIYHQADFNSPLALIIGGEAGGASQIAYQVAESLVHIPMSGGIDSLNASVSAGILLFEITRQRGSQE
jgi:TrmH family RNA methyltransferase